MTEEFSLLGPFPEGLPGEVDLWLSQEGEIERLADEIISACDKPGDRRRRSPGDQWSTLAFMLIAWHSKKNRPVPAVVLKALAYTMGLVSFDTRAATPSKKVLDRVNLPTQVETWMLTKYLVASRLDGEADAAGWRLLRGALAAELAVSTGTIDNWRKQAPYQRRRDTVRTFADLAASIYRKKPPQDFPRLTGLKDQCDWIRARYWGD